MQQPPFKKFKLSFCVEEYVMSTCALLQPELDNFLYEFVLIVENAYKLGKYTFRVHNWIHSRF